MVYMIRWWTQEMKKIVTWIVNSVEVVRVFYWCMWSNVISIKWFVCNVTKWLLWKTCMVIWITVTETTIVAMTTDEIIEEAVEEEIASQEIGWEEIEQYVEFLISNESLLKSPIKSFMLTLSNKIVLAQGIPSGSLFTGKTPGEHL